MRYLADWDYHALNDQPSLRDCRMSALISNVLTPNYPPFNVSQHSMPSWQCNGGSRRDGDNLRVCDASWWPRQKCWIRCKLVTLICDRDRGVSVSTGHNIFSLHIVPVFLSIKENLKSKSNLDYWRKERGERTGILSAKGETTTDWFLIKCIPVRSESLLDAP